MEPFDIGSIVHITQRGTRGTAIMRDAADGMRIIKTFRYLNDTHTDQFWHRSVSGLPSLKRPDSWPERDPLVRVLAWTVLSNHFHLLVQEIREGGIAKFMQRANGSLTKYFNTKYKEKGSLFQSSYHARTVSGAEHYQYLVFYILVKNVLEMYPGGLTAVTANFDSAWEWAKQYPYSSFRDSISGTSSPILDDEEGLISGVIGTDGTYKQEARELLDFYTATHGADFAPLMLEPW